MGHKQTYAVQNGMSALPPIATSIASNSDLGNPVIETGESALLSLLALAATAVAIVFSLGRSYLDLLFLLVDRSPLCLLLVGCGCLRRLLGLAGALQVVGRRLDHTRHEALNALGP